MQTLKRVTAEMKEDSVPLLGAGVAFYAYVADTLPGSATDGDGGHDGGGSDGDDHDRTSDESTFTVKVRN